MGEWLVSHVDLKYILTLFAKTNINYNKSRSDYIGYSDYYILGIRIARIQKTAPWD